LQAVSNPLNAIRYQIPFKTSSTSEPQQCFTTYGYLNYCYIPTHCYRLASADK